MNNKLLNILNKKQIEQLTDLWFKTRYNMITASECSSALEANPFFKKYDLLKKKCNPLQPSLECSATYWGKKFEDVAYELYSKLTNKKLYKLGLLQHEKFCWLGASPDGITEDCKLLEIKCVYNRKIGKKEPYYYWIQVQIQMEVTDTNECDLFQCKFTEYKSRRDYIKDKSTPQLFKGYSEYEGEKFYWKLEKFTCNTIKRDKVWFDNHVLILNQFYNDILYYRSNGIPNKKKRKSSDIDEPVSKRTRLNSLRGYLKHDWTKWVSATDVKNYIMDDPIIDWFNLYGGRFNLKSDKMINSKFNFNEFILNKGVEFEAAVILNLMKRFNTSVVTIANIYEGYSIDKYNMTIKEMFKGTPIIVSGILHNYNNNTYGIPDIIVRSDYLNKIVESEVISIEEEKKGCKFSDNWHYCIIDIKFTTLNFMKQQNAIKNIGNIKAYKSQVIIYNSALGVIQNYEPSECYLLGRKIRKNNKKYNSFYDLGRVKINGHDYKLKDKINSAISWIKKLKKNGSKWNPEDMEIKELFPNMSNKNDYPWHYEKKKLANKTKELTAIWKIGINERNLLHKMGITSWDNIGVNSKMLNLNDKNGKIFDKILDINKSDDVISDLSCINNEIILNNSNKKEYYVDFETTGDLNESFNDIINFKTGDNTELNESNNIIYMIGVGWFENRKWNFKNFVVNRLSFYEEKKIIDKFLELIGDNNIIYHWSNAEPSLLKKSFERYKYNNNVNWYDLLKFFKEIPIVVNGSYSYGLKSIAKTMYKQKLINTNWVDSTLDGLGAMLVAWIAEEECSKNNIYSIQEFSEIKDIIKYNEIDCKVMWDILRYIRSIRKIKMI